jgi:hypothetical protein
MVQFVIYCSLMYANIKRFCDFCSCVFWSYFSFRTFGRQVVFSGLISPSEYLEDRQQSSCFRALSKILPGGRRPRLQAFPVSSEMRERERERDRERERERERRRERERERERGSNRIHRMQKYCLILWVSANYVMRKTNFLPKQTN